MSQSLLQEQMDRDFTCQSSVIGMRRNFQYSLRYSVHVNAIMTVFDRITSFFPLMLLQTGYPVEGETLHSVRLLV